VYLKIIFIIVISVYVSCSKDHFPQVNTEPCAIRPKIPKLQQGLYGTIHYKHGNCMPTFNSETQTCITACYPTSLYLTKPITYNAYSHPYYNNLPAPVITVIKSDDSGYFENYCDSGFYSVFVKWHDGFYAQNISAGGFVNLIHITTDSLVNSNFTIDEAVY
jgi:hypothetical protein